MSKPEQLRLNRLRVALDGILLGEREAPTIIVGMFFAFVVAATLKNDAQVNLTSQWWASLSHSNEVNLIKKYAFVFLAIGAASSIYVSLREFHFVTPISAPVVLMVVAYLAAALRLTYDDLGAGVRFFVGLATFLCIVSVTIAGIVRYGFRPLLRSVSIAVVLAGALVVAINLAEYVMGYGYVPDNPRMFGTAVHANIFGIQLALFLVFFAREFIYRKNIFIRVGIVIVSLGCVFLMIRSGSRTAVMIIATMVLTLILLRMRLRALPSLAIILLIFSSIFVVASLVDLSGLGESFNRNIEGSSGDTRSAAWMSLISQIQQAPAFGHGLDVVFNESSYLFGWASYGVLYFLALTFAALFAALRAYSAAFKTQDKDAEFLAGLSWSLLVGSFFEAFLSDAYSLPTFLQSVIIACGCAMTQGSPARERISPDQASEFRRMAVRKRLPSRRLQPRNRKVDNLGTAVELPHEGR